MARAGDVGFVVGKVALGQIFLSKSFDFPHQYHSTAASYSLMYHLWDGQWDIVSPHYNNKKNTIENKVMCKAPGQKPLQSREHGTHIHVLISYKLDT
jgi:hypothetical protein